MDAPTDFPAHPAEPFRENLNLGEVAVFLDVGLTTVRDMIRRGELPHARIGRRVLVPRTALRRWLEKRTVDPSSAS